MTFEALNDYSRLPLESGSAKTFATESLGNVTFTREPEVEKVSWVVSFENSEISGHLVLLGDALTPAEDATEVQFEFKLVDPNANGDPGYSEVSFQSLLQEIFLI